MYTYESSSIENLVVSGTGTVDNELGLLDSRGVCLDGSHFKYINEEKESNGLITFHLNKNPHLQRKNFWWLLRAVL